MKTSLQTAVFMLTCAVIGSAAYAQSGGNMAEFQKFRAQHKYTFQLSATVYRGFSELERTPSTKLKPAQAKQILTVLNPLRKQSKLTQDQAKATIQKLQRALDERQLSAIDRVLNSSGRSSFGSGRPGGGPGAGPSGNRPSGANASRRPAFDPAKMKDFNPFNPGKPTSTNQRQIDRVKRLFDFLQARAANKPATLSMKRPGPSSSSSKARKPGSKPAPKAK